MTEETIQQQPNAPFAPQMLVHIRATEHNLHTDMNMNFNDRIDSTSDRGEATHADILN